MLHLFTDFASKLENCKMWVHVTTANIQDPLDFGNNLGMKLNREKFNVTMDAFRLAEQHMSALKLWGANNGDETLSPWGLSTKHTFLSFFWPNEVLARGDNRDGKHAEAFCFLNKLTSLNKLTGSTDNGNGRSVSSKLTSSNVTETGGTCPLCFKKIKTYEEQTNHIKAKHALSFSLFPNSMVGVIEELASEMKSVNRDSNMPASLAKDLDASVYPSMAANCNIFIASRSRSKSPSVSLDEGDESGFLSTRSKLKKSSANSPMRGSSGRNNLRIETINTAALKSESTRSLDFPTTPSSTSPMTPSPPSPTTPSSPMTPGGLPNTPQQGRPKNGTVVEREQLMVSLKMVHHATRLAGHPGILRDIEKFMEENSKHYKQALGLVEVENDSKKKKKRRKKKRGGSTDFDEWTESSSVGTVDSLNDTFDGFTLAPLENITESFQETASPEQATVTPTNGKKERRGKRDLRPPSNPGTPNQDTHKVPVPTEIHLSFEDFKDRRDSLGDKQKQEEIKNGIQGMLDQGEDEKQRKSSTGEKMKNVEPSPIKTTASTSWANVTKGGQANSEEITIGSTMIRARLIDPKMHEIMDPGMKDRIKEKKQLKAEDGVGWFKDVKKRMMVVLNVNDSNYNIVLEHGKVSGKKSLTINGKKLAVKGKQILDFGGQFKFRIAHVDMSITVECKLSGTFKYKFFIGGIKDPVLVDNMG